MAKWEPYAVEKIGLAFNKLVESPDSGWAGGALAEAQSDLSAVFDKSMPDDEARALLNAVKNATTIDIALVRAISSLYVKALEDRD